ncbi:protein of unknown function [Shewanella benthica]|uniref:Uncharacterized protein n=1 Tax=Shewanella benthica TaxID=43661 RepID=A0A330M4G7_9GAMM|nr:protein of unknown function [Shewanella benthica]
MTSYPSNYLVNLSSALFGSAKVIDDIDGWYSDMLDYSWNMRALGFFRDSSAIDNVFPVK